MRNRKLVIIVMWLIPEAVEKDDEAIAKEIREELESRMPRIPYCERIEKLTVLSEQ